MQELTKKRTGKIMIVLLSLIVALTFTIAMTDNADAAAAKKFTIKYGSKKIVVQTVKNGKAKLTTYKALQKKLGKFKRYKDLDLYDSKGYRYKKKGFDVIVCDNKQRKCIGPYYFTIKTKKAKVFGIKVGMSAKKARKIWKKRSEIYEKNYDSGFNGEVIYSFEKKNGKVVEIEVNGS